MSKSKLGKEAYASPGLSPFLLSLILLIGASIAYFFQGMVPYYLVYASFGIILLLSLLAKKHAFKLFAANLLLLSVFIIGHYTGITSLIGGWLIVCSTIFLITLIWIMFDTGPDTSSTDCTLCKTKGQLKKSSKWLTNGHTGPCYVCMGKGEIKTEHPHYETYQILRKYEHDLKETKDELKKLTVDHKEVAEQKKQASKETEKSLHKQAEALEKQYRDQVKLRETQINFLTEGMTKLHTNMYSSFLASQMLDKKKALGELYEDNTNDLGTVMARKAQLEMHTEMLDRINALSIEMDLHESSNIAKELEKEIKQMEENI